MSMFSSTCWTVGEIARSDKASPLRALSTRQTWEHRITRTQDPARPRRELLPAGEVGARNDVVGVARCTVGAPGATRNQGQGHAPKDEDGLVRPASTWGSGQP